MNPPTLAGRAKTFADILLDGKTTATAAYIAAGYSPKGAKGASSRLAATPAVIAYIDAQREAMSERTRIKKFEVLDFLSRAITTPIGNIDEASDLAQEVTRDEIGEEVARTKIKMVGKIDAIDRLAKMLGWYAPEKHQIDASDELADLIRETRAGK